MPELCQAAVYLSINNPPLKSFVWLILVALVCPHSLPAQAVPEPGVSLALARERSGTIRHVSYGLDLKITDTLDRLVEGTVILAFDYLPDGSPLQIDFKADPQQVKGIVVNGREAPIILRKEHLLIAPRYLPRGSNHILIYFTAGNRPLNRNPEFLYTLLVPDRARELFPCFDQPDLKAVFSLNLRLPQGWTAVANAPAMSPGSFFPSDTIPTYPFAFAAGRFTDSVRMTNHGPMHAFYRETDTVKIRASLDTLFRIQSQALDFLEDYTQIPFPFKKFDFVAIPDFQFGGMEHPGAIQYKASALFLDEAATREQSNARANVLSHETSHMWFGDLVTMRWFDDVWMKEVFANFMADKIGALTAPGSNYDLKFLTDHLPAAYGIDRTEGSNPIRQRLDNLKDAGSLYGNIIYHKAPVMMRQLELQMGAGPFKDGIREYLKTFAYGNASWPDLIHILGKHSSMDLEAWNKVWVGETGRPLFRAAYRPNGDLLLSQTGEDDSRRVWPQVFQIAEVFSDHIETHTVQMASRQTIVHASAQRPLYRLFNAGGEGYGVFPVDTAELSRLSALEDPVMRASAYINLYENMLDGRVLAPAALLRLDLGYLLKEPEELNLGILLGQVGSIYWRLLLPPERQRTAPALEITLWKAMGQASGAGDRKLLFMTYANIALTRGAEDSVYHVWKTQLPPRGIKLSEEDYNSLAAGLALRNYPGSAAILDEQGRRIQNPDRRARFQYLLPSLSPVQAVRDSFFLSLHDPVNRAKESWVLSALGNLHHPLRVGEDEKYLGQSLDWLTDIQRTGDVFFPQSWLSATLGYYQTATAAALVRRWLKLHPDYDPRLRGKVLQASDYLLRLQRLERNGGRPTPD
jgi:aminopeptidase N